MKHTIIIFWITVVLTSCNSKKKQDVISLNNLDITKLEKVDASFRTRVLDKISSVSELKSDYEAFFYKKFQVNSFKAILVYVVRDSYGIIHLLLFDNNDKMISSVPLAGDICAGPGEENGFVVWCNEVSSTFTSEADFHITTVKKKSNDFANSPLFVDTIKKYFSIVSDGSVKQVRSVLVRVEKQLDEHGKEK